MLERVEGTASIESFPLANPFSKNSDFSINESKKGVCPRWVFSLPKLSKIKITTFLFVGLPEGFVSVIGLNSAFNSLSV